MKRYPILFFSAVVAGMLLSGGFFWAHAEKPPTTALSGRWLTATYFVREQMTPQDVALARQSNFRTIIDLRPDGEALGQPSSGEMAEAAKREGLAFHYVPVSPGPVPDEAVTKLGDVMNDAEWPVLIYCRSGSRAARTWALAEASRFGGDNVQSILQRVRDAGFGADDLKDAIIARIAARTRAEK